MTQQLVMGMPSNQLPLHYSWSIPGTNDNDPVSQIFNQFCAADTFRGIMELFQQLCDATGLYPTDHVIFYELLKTRLMSWKARSLWTKLDKRAKCSEYKRGLACNSTRVLIIGAGPCGLRVAIEMALLGAKTVIVEKRYSFSRNNVLHLWPFVIHDLKTLGAKKFFGKFCAGSIDHISIRTLQCILLKVALLLGVEVHPEVSFEGFVEPHIGKTMENNGWRATVCPSSHPVSEFIFDVCFSADGQRNTMTEFKRKELRGKFAIGITANFINCKTQAEASVEEISGVSYIFNQKFFKDLHENAGIDLENIVYYKDETHYFVMTAKKRSLLRKGVLLQDYDDPESLLSKENVDKDALLSYAREAADYSTHHHLPSLDSAPNHLGQPDVDIFDFTSMFAAEHACRVVERQGHELLIGLVGDTLLEPFWPTGSGCARGFLGALDGAWMVRSWASGEMSPLEVIAERESVYQLLSQTTSENLNKNYENYTIDPNTRYSNLQVQICKPYQVQSLYDGNDGCNIIQVDKKRNPRYDYLRKRWILLQWFQKKLKSYENLVRVVDLTGSWRSGLALCALIHRHRPHLIDVFALDPNQVESNNQLAFDILEKHCNISPIATGPQMTRWKVPDERLMMSYLSSVQDFFKQENPYFARVERKLSSSERALHIAFTETRTKKEVFEGKKSMNQHQVSPPDVMRPFKCIRDTDADQTAVNCNKSLKVWRVVDAFNEPSETLPLPKNKVSVLKEELVSKLKADYSCSEDKKQTPKSLVLSTDVCSFCKERVFVVERCIAEGLLFHRQCFRCEFCSGLLNVTSYVFQMNGEGKEIFCHAHCHEAQHKRTEKPVFPLDQSRSRVILPVDWVTFNATRNKLLKQSKINQNQTWRKEHKQDSGSQQNFFGSLTFNDFSSSTEEELCFSSDSDSEKPDLSWDECVRHNEAFISPTLIEKETSPLENTRECRIEKMDDGGSDADWETESEMDVPLKGFEDHNDNANKTKKAQHYKEINNKEINNKEINNKEIKSGASEATTLQVSQSENAKLSIVQESKLQNRKAFFDAVAQPVRINAHLFLGLGPQIEGGSEEKASPGKSTCIENGQSKTDNDMETKKMAQGNNVEEIQGLNEINTGSGKEITSERHRKQTKRKKRLKIKRKKPMKTKKQPDRRKTEGVPCTTEVARTTVAAFHHTVAVVPLSEEEESSSDEEETRQEKKVAVVNSDSSRNDLLADCADGSFLGTNSVFCLSSNSEQGEKVTESSADEIEGRYLPEGSDKEELLDNVLDPLAYEGEAPRPSLLLAEAMFRSYEEEAVVAASCQPEEFSESTGEEDNVSPQLAKETEVFKKNEMKVVCIDNDAFIKQEHSNAEQNHKNKANETDSLDELVSDENVQASCEDSLKSRKNDSCYGIGISVPHQVSDFIGEEDDGKLTRNRENLLSSAKSGAESEGKEVGLMVEDFPGLRNGGSLGKLLKKEIAPKAEVESLSEDDKDMCSDFGKKQMAKNYRVENTTQVNCSKNELEHDKVTKEAKVSVAEVGIDVEDDLEFIDHDVSIISLDPMSCRNCLLRSLSSSKDNIVKPLSDTVLQNEQLVVTSDLEESNICSEQQLTTLSEQHSCETMSLGFWTDEEEEKGEVRAQNFNSEKLNNTAVCEKRCIVDENINYISPLSANEAKQKNRGQSCSLVPITRASLICDRCICMEDKDVDEAELLEVHQNELSVETEEDDDDASEYKALAKENNHISKILTQEEKGTMDVIRYQVPTVEKRTVDAQENVAKIDENREICGLLENSKSIEDVRKTLEIKESRSLFPQDQKLLTVNVVSPVSGKVLQNFSKTSAANKIQSFDSDAQVTGGAVKEQDCNPVNSIRCSTNIPCSVTSSSIWDAKRRFLQEIPQPVRINPHVIFKDDFLLDKCSSTSNLQEKMTTDSQTFSSASSDASRTAVIIQPKLNKEQTEADVLANREQTAKRRLLPAIPIDQLPLDLALNTFTVADVLQVNSSKIIQPPKEPNVLSLSDGEIYRRMEQNNRRLLPPFDGFSHSNNFFKSFGPPVTKVAMVPERWSSLPMEQISWLSEDKEIDSSDSYHSSTGNGQKDDGFKKLAVRDDTNTSGAVSSATTAMTKNWKSRDFRGARSTSLDSEINNLYTVERTDSLLGNAARNKGTERNLTNTSATHQKLSNSSLELKRTAQEYRMEIKTTSGILHQER